MYYERKLVSNSVLNEAYHEIEFMWHGQLRTMKIQMFRDEISKLIFEITPNVPRFEIEEISIKELATFDVYEIGRFFNRQPRKESLAKMIFALIHKDENSYVTITEIW